MGNEVEVRRAVPGRGDAEEPTGRTAAILNAVVEEHIATGQPVGSSTVARAPEVQVSSATVRAEMVALEREGFLEQPHTSAGRVPTDRGYRFFVDHLEGEGRLSPEQGAQVRRFFADMHLEVEALLRRTTGLLARLTDYAAVVVGPTHDAAAVRSVQLVGLAPKVALLVVVLADGAIEKRTLDLPTDADDLLLAAAGVHLSRHLQGTTLTSVERPPSSGDPAVDALVELAREQLATLHHGGPPDQVFVGGSSRMAAACDAVDTVRSVLAILEEQLVVVELVEDVLDRGLSVAIGTEHGFEPLSSCALVVAPVAVDGEAAGRIGVLGPTRMNYPVALAAVRAVGEQLSERLARNRTTQPEDGGGKGCG
jgi:heat-inducible transcriptional repressor